MNYQFPQPYQVAKVNGERGHLQLQILFPWSQRLSSGDNLIFVEANDTYIYNEKIGTVVDYSNVIEYTLKDNDIIDIKFSGND